MKRMVDKEMRTAWALCRNSCKVRVEHVLTGFSMIITFYGVSEQRMLLTDAGYKFIKPALAARGANPDDWVSSPFWVAGT